MLGAANLLNNLDMRSNRTRGLQTILALLFIYVYISKNCNQTEIRVQMMKEGDEQCIMVHYTHTFRSVSKRNEWAADEKNKHLTITNVIHVEEIIEKREADAVRTRNLPITSAHLLIWGGKADVRADFSTLTSVIQDCSGIDAGHVCVCVCVSFLRIPHLLQASG